MDHEKFLRLTWYEWSLYLEGYNNEVHEHDREVSELMAHIANCTAPKKSGNWTWKEFSRFKHITQVQERKLTLKEAKRILGSKMKKEDGK